MFGKVITAVQSRLAHIESVELDEITKEAKDEAVRLALILSKYPAPPIPVFDIDDTYKDAEKLADLVDDVFKRETSEEESYKDDVTSHADDTPKVAISDSEAMEKCQEFKDKYQVVVGVSWGNLPYDLQQQWLQYSCDYHLKSS
jgi:TPP-dependent trihydroxycyclohexane-1,2-dione (THcHDO) dehydratase